MRPQIHMFRGMNRQSIIFLEAPYTVAAKMTVRSSSAAPLKLVPFLDHSYVGQPRRAIIRRNAMIAESVLSDTTSLR